MTGLKHLTYELTQSLGGFQVAKFLSRNHPKIFMYHRINDDQEARALRLDVFRKQIELIKKNFNPMTLTDLLQAKEKGSAPRDAVVLTFDDGYGDFYDNAFPILNDAKVPVTLFLTTGFVNNDTWLWPDMIRYAIGRSVKRNLKISELDKIFDVKRYPELTWNSVASYCLAVSNTRKMEIINEIFNQLDVSLPTSAPEQYQALTWDQVREMVSSGLDVGSHSVTHPVLTKLGSQQLIRELKESKSKIESELGTKVEIFCYPNGQKGDFNSEIKNAIKDCGYRYAVTAFSGPDPLSDQLEINRYPASYTIEGFMKNIYGLTLFSMKARKILK